MPVFEAVMMICFSVSWVFSIARSLRSRSTGGKSVIFLWIVLIGYISGIIHKYLNAHDWVIWLYSVNASMVATDMLLYYRNYFDERARGASNR